MSLIDEALRVLEIEFLLVEHASEPPASFRLIPYKYQPSDKAIGRFVYVGVVLRERGFECAAYDVLGVGDFQRMRAVLDGYRKAVPESCSVRGWDNQFEFEMRWREPQLDVGFVGRIPPHPWQAHSASNDPTVYRTRLRLDVHFEFWLDPRRLDDPIDQLDVLLTYLVDEQRRAAQSL